jgi:hypothetical protein
MTEPARNRLGCFLSFLFLAAALSLFCAPAYLAAQTAPSLEPGPKPQDIPVSWKPWIGDYGTDEVSFTVGESEGHLFILEFVPSGNSDHSKKWDLSEAPIEKPVTAERTDKTIVVIDFHRDAVGKQVLLTNDLGWSK